MEQKEAKSTIESLQDELKKLRAKMLDISNYKQWSWQQILKWIITIENGKFGKYEKQLRKALSEETPSGEDIEYINGDDIKRWGVRQFGDIKILLSCIQQLGNDNMDNTEIGDNDNDNDDGAAAPDIIGDEGDMTYFIE